jgi:hypothetical protein
MAIDAISSAMSDYVQKVTASTSQTAIAAVVQETNETVDVTRQEAARGDQQAVRKLARHSQVDHLA